MDCILKNFLFRIYYLKSHLKNLHLKEIIASYTSHYVLHIQKFFVGKIKYHNLLRVSCFQVLYNKLFTISLLSSIFEFDRESEHDSKYATKYILNSISKRPRDK